MNRYALLSVTDKTGLVSFAETLTRAGLKILSTGGTAAVLREAQIDVLDVEDYTGLPSIFDGRVKTLHPAIHGGILYDRERDADVNEHKQRAYHSIDLVVVNLYNFAEEALNKKLRPSEAIRHIDIGGPSMLRGAAKNWASVGVVIDPGDYEAVGKAIERDRFFGAEGANFRLALSCKAFAATAQYDEMISSYLKEACHLHCPDEHSPNEHGPDIRGPVGSTPDKNETNFNRTKSQDPEDYYPDNISLKLKKIAALRYGENPHQNAAFYRDTLSPLTGLAGAKQLQGKELSYNNYLDLDAAYALALDLQAQPAAVIIKHTNPCGAAIGLEGEKSPLHEVYDRALAGDPKSAFGSIVAFTRLVDMATAKAIAANFVECIIAPAYEEGAIEILGAKKNLRLLELEFNGLPTEQRWRSIAGGILVQEVDSWRPEKDSSQKQTDSSKAVHSNSEQWRHVAGPAPDIKLSRDLEFCMLVAAHVKSNAIVYGKDGQLLGVGAGQMSRIDAGEFAAQKATAEGRSLAGCAMASDAFFPFADSVQLAYRYQVAGICQPGGSRRDQESIDACNEAGISMIFTGRRHFRH